MASSTKQDMQALYRQIPVREGIVLRPVQEADSDRILAILDADPTIRQRVSMASWVKNREDLQQQIAISDKAAAVIRYSIIAAQDCVGMVSLWSDNGYFGHDPEVAVYGFSYFLDPAARGKGIVSDCVNALMAAADKDLTVRSFIAFSEDDNESSIAILKREGFEPTDITYSEPNTGWTERKYVKEVQHG